MSETYRIGIDLGGTRIKTGLVKDGRVVESNIFGAKPDEGLQTLLVQLEERIIQLSKIAKAPIEAIGLAFPGIVDIDKNMVIDTSAKYRDAPSVDLVTWVKKKFNLPFRMDNDARLACLGEWRYGAGQGVANMVMLTLGTGIGTAVIMEGKLLRGKHFQAGILGGHMVIDYKNKIDKCSCGKYGCIEAIASMWMLGNMARQHSLFRESLLSRMEMINWEVILKLSEQGDELSEILKQHCLEVWGVGLVNLIHAYDPEKVVIGGGISYAEEILPYFRKVVEERAWCPEGVPEICAAKFPDTAAVLGASALFE